METTLRILDIQEKEVGEVKPPSFPTPTSTATGFPQPKIRSRQSAFKRQRQPQTSEPAPKPVRPAEQAQPDSFSLPTQNGAPKQPGSAEEERRAIDTENKARLAAMSEEEIDQERQELFQNLDPRLIQMLLQRSNVDEDKSSWPFEDDPYRPEDQEPRDAPSEEPRSQPTGSEVKGSVADSSKAARVEEDEEVATVDTSSSIEKPKPKKTVTFNEDAEPSEIPTDLFPITNPPPKTNTTHFPHGPATPDLDPADPDFLANLHTKYFPNLPADPSKLAWMAPLPTPNSIADRESPYHPNAESVPVSQLRFDFRGVLIPPSLSRRIPVTRGLHNHGEAPEAAGYTIPELARLARSSVPAQRCIAFQTLGRMLYRLGKGEWGSGQGGRMGDEDDLAFGLWRCFKETRVLESLGEAAAVEDGAGHRGSKVYAIEALWLFEKGGWKEKWRGM